MAVHYDRHSYFRHLFALTGSVAQNISGRVVLVAGFSVVVCLLNRYKLVAGMPSTVHAVLGTVLGLMMAFRTQTGYDRFWEGRRAWGAVVNRTRDLGRHVTALVPDHRLQRALLVHVIGFVHTMRRHLWGEHEVPELDRLFDAAEATSLREAPGPLHRTLLFVSKELAALRIDNRLDPLSCDRIERDLTDLVDQLGACQRIKRTPIPFAYVIHMRRFLLIFLLSLPFAIVESLGWITPFAMLFAAYGLFGVEEIGSEIEDPFDRTPNDIDLEPITTAIETELLALVGESTGAPAPDDDEEDRVFGTPT